MLNRHFFKTLVLFTGMILLGLIGIFLVSYFDEGGVDHKAEAYSNQ